MLSSDYLVVTQQGRPRHLGQSPSIAVNAESDLIVLSMGFKAGPTALREQALLVVFRLKAAKAVHATRECKTSLRMQCLGDTGSKRHRTVTKCMQDHTWEKTLKDVGSELSLEDAR